MPIYRVTANFSGPFGDLRQWVWYYQESGAGDSYLEIIDAIIVILTAVWNLIKAYIDTDTSGDTIDLALYDAGTDSWNTVVSGDISALVGEGDDLGLPGNSAPYVTFFTSVAKSRGKKFLFDVGRVNQIDGLLDGALIANMLLAAAQWNNTVTPTTTDYFPGNFNQATGTFNRWLATPVGAGAFAGSQYRRLPGRGA